MSSARMEHTPARSINVIRPSSGLAHLELKELWAYRELLYFLTLRDIKVRYKQTSLGVGWAIIQPFASMVLFSVVFGRLAGLPSDDLPYPIFTYSALLPWMLFANGLSRSGNSVVSGGGMITKVYFPRLIIPLSATTSPLVDFALAFVILAGMMGYFGTMTSVAVLTLPLFLLIAMAMALGVGLWLAAINARFRDVRLAIPFLIQTWLFTSPVVYSSSLLPERWQSLYELNPMTGAVQGFRWALLGTDWQPGPSFVASISIVIVILVSGALYFQRMQKTFADVI